MPHHAPTRRNRPRWRTPPSDPDFDPAFDPDALAADPETADVWHPAERASRLPGWIPAPLRKTLRITFKTTVVLTLIGLAVALFYLCLSFRYDLNEVTAMPERTVILDHKNREIAALHGENRRIIPRGEIPGFFVEALLAREDKRFFDHHGVDLSGLARATLRNIKDLSFTQGASTLTMQLARNSFDIRERSLHRKLLEIALAFRIEAHYSKDEILASYVNRIYFGSGCHGIEEAARRYFDRSTAELTPTQSAMLAGIIRAPHACSPLRNLDGAIKQRDEVLARMVHEEYLTPAKAEKIKAYPLQLNTDPDSATNMAGRAVRRHYEALLDDPVFDQGGVRIRSAINANIQLLVESELRRLDENLDANLQLAAVCVDPRNGAIRAIVGGRPAVRATHFNRALDARRGLGAAFSPFLLAAAAERGYPIDPDNLVSTGRRIGVAETTRLVKRLGFTGPFAENDDLFRGTVAATPLELATAVATLSNEGQRPHTYLLQEIISPRGEFLFTQHPRLIPAISPQAASESLAEQFPASNAPKIHLGLSPGRTDAWAMFFHPRFALVLWTGHDQPRPLSSPEDTLDKLDKTIIRLARDLAPTR